ncbi:DUF3857 domain-containing protein [Arenimonas sp.]|uniref:DUF3857 domain-containing protein n=1 Tax=Arenimonas sp. TaxID=1872635 RepID=UPI0025BC5C00|nr:DUF3857 domain-containing protein [Arenimonas sp.]
MSGRMAALWLASLLAVAQAAAAGLPAGLSLADTPDWVAPVDVASIPAGKASGGVAYRVVDDQVSLRGQRPHEYRLLAYDVTDRTGLEDAGRLRIGFQPDFQTVQLHGLVVVRDGQRGDRRGQARVELLRLEERANDGILDGWRTAEILVPDVQVGDRVELSFSTIGSNPVLGDHYHRTFPAAYSTATGLRRLRVLAGDDALSWRRTGPVAFRERERRDGSGHVLELQARSVPAIAGESDAPDWFDGYGVLEISTAPDWAAVATWAARLFRAGPGSRAPLAKLAGELGLAGKPQAEAVAEALAFVQREVRYVSLSIGDSSHAPADPATTLSRRYGDCKDKSLLLVGLLAEAGIDAQPVLVNSTLEGRIAERLPGPNAFDHAIVRARVDGEWLYVDPTRNPEQGGFADRQPTDFGQGLPVAPGVAALEAFPVAAPSPKPAVEVTQVVKLHGVGEDSRVDIRVDTRYRYGFASSSRSRFASDGATEVGRDYLGYMEGFYRDIELVSDPVGKDSPQENRFDVSEHYRADLRRDDVEPGSLGEFSLHLFQLNDWVPAARAATRAWPLLLPGPPHGVQEIRMHADGGWDIETEEHEVANDYFRFRRHVSAEGEVLTVRGEWYRLADAIAPEDYAAARAQLAEVRDLLEYPVLLGDGEAATGPEISRDDLAWPAAALLLAAILLGTLWTVRGRSDVAGMFFAPRATARRVLAADSVPLAMLWLLGNCVVALALTGAPELVAGAEPAWGLLLLEALAEVPRYLVVVAMLMVAFRLMGHRPGFRRLLIASGWGSVPYLFVLMLGLLAAGPLVAVLSDAGGTPHGDVPVIVVMSVVAGGLLLVALAWWLVASVPALAEAAGSSLGKAFAAWLMVVATLLFVVFTAVFLYFLVVEFGWPGSS